MIDELYSKLRSVKAPDAHVKSDGKVINPEKPKPHHKLSKRPDTKTLVNR